MTAKAAWLHFVRAMYWFSIWMVVLVLWSNTDRLRNQHPESFGWRVVDPRWVLPTVLMTLFYLWTAKIRDILIRVNDLNDGSQLVVILVHWIICVPVCYGILIFGGYLT